VNIRVEVVRPGKLYRIIEEYTVKGSPPLPVWAAATLFLTALAATLYFLSTTLERVERYMPWTLPLLGIAVTIMLIRAIVGRRSKSPGGMRVEG